MEILKQPLSLDDKAKSYLHFGYLPFGNIPGWLLEIWKLDIQNHNYTIEEASSIFDCVFDSLVNETNSQRYIVPLSGGWDSRAILGGLLERVGASKIETISFGAPGQLDYDLGKKIAESFGVKHHALDLRTIKISWEELLKYVKISPWTYNLDAMFNSICRNLISDEYSSVWIGFLGDPLTGSHISNVAVTLPVEKFIEKQKRINSCQILNPYSVSKLNISSSVNNSKYVNDMLDFGIRQLRCIAPIVLPEGGWNSWDPVIGTEKNGAKIIAPFTNRQWAKFWLFAPKSARLGQNLYLKMLKSKFDKLFALPSKYSLGVPESANFQYIIKKINHSIRCRTQRHIPQLGVYSRVMENYLEFNEIFRKRTDYKEILYSAFDYLKTKDIVPWLNLDDIRNKHLKRQINCADAFIVLIGLAANLVVEEMENS